MGYRVLTTVSDHEHIQNATKACHGLFPKQLLAETTMSLAAQFHIKQILPAGHDTHIYRHWRYALKKKIRFTQ